VEGMLTDLEVFVALGGDSHWVQEGYIIVMKNLTNIIFTYSSAAITAFYCIPPVVFPVVFRRACLPHVYADNIYMWKACFCDGTFSILILER